WHYPEQVQRVDDIRGHLLSLALQAPPKDVVLTPALYRTPGPPINQRKKAENGPSFRTWACLAP
ncbi:MAG: hypothetical protein ACYC1M_19385, partial [Armatimonadota bacterium]